VEAVHQLLTQELGVRHLQAVIGFSMGAQQAFQWAVSYPDYMDRIVATSGTAKTYGHGIVRLESEITALTTDEAFKGGDYKEEPVKGIQAFSLVWTAWLFSQEWWREELWKSDEPLQIPWDVHHHDALITPYQQQYFQHLDPLIVQQVFPPVPHHQFRQ
jgi:homoserine O-acetyltransferase